MRRLLGALLISILASLGLLSPVVSADVNDFTITDFHGRYELFNDTPAGRMIVQEKLDVNFTDNNHGILRAIPDSYKNNKLDMKVLSVKRDGSEEPYSTYSSNRNEVLKIGSADKTITGRHSYEITYEIRNVVSFYDKYDEWYWDINGDQWLQRFEKVSGEVIFPANWSNSGIPQGSCYAGVLNATTQYCVIEKTDNGYKFESSRTLGPGETLTVVSAIPKGLFRQPTALDKLKENLWQIIGLLAGISSAIYAYLTWRKFGKDVKGRGTIIPEYEPPAGLTPGEIGLLNDYNMDGRDYTATIIDLAVRGFVRIHDEEKKSLGLFKRREFSLELINSDTSGLKEHESALLTALFNPIQAGTTVKISDIDKQKMYNATVDIKKKMLVSLRDSYGLFDKTPASAYLKPLVPMIAVIVVMAFSVGWGWSTGGILSVVSYITAMILMRRRTHAGQDAYEKILGLKMYMNTAERDRLKMMQSVDRPYAEPEKTVDLYEKLLPFAVALGVESSWSKQFEGIYKQPPGWYDGNFNTFHMASFASSLNSGVSAMNTSFAASTSSSGSGSGGGGFSGGGGGGGGGGGW